MLKCALLGVSLVVAPSAWAGCFDYEGDAGSAASAPTIEICYRGDCEETAVAYECANAFSASVGLRNGWVASVLMNDGSGRAGLPSGTSELREIRRSETEVTDLENLACRDPSESGFCSLFD